MTTALAWLVQGLMVLPRYYLSYNAGLNGMPWLYQVEILPTHLRAKGAVSASISHTHLIVSSPG